MQTILDKTINIISINKEGLLIHSTCLYPFYSPDNTKVAFWVQEYDSERDIYLSTYQLYVKDLRTNELSLVNTGNGNCPIVENTMSNRFIYSAMFSPDSTKILFLSTSTNLVPSDPLSTQTPNTQYRWYVKNLSSNDFMRIASSNTAYGNKQDFYEALWRTTEDIVFVSYSNNLVTGAITSVDHLEVYEKNITTGDIRILSRLEDGNISPYFTTSSFNISVTSDKVAFYSTSLGFCIKYLNTSNLVRVQTLPGVSTYGIVDINVFNWNNDGSKFIFRIETGTSITPDTNNVGDDFVYDLLTDTIIPINENSAGTVFGDGLSKSSLFAPDGNRVAFLSDSRNIDVTSDNPIINLYVKDLTTGDLTRISKSITNDNITSDVLGYAWLSNDRIVFTSYSNELVAGDTNNVLDWFIRDISSSTTRRINYNDSTLIFSENNEYSKNIRRETFNVNGNTILFSAKLENINPTFYTPGLFDYSIFAKVFEDHMIAFPPSGIYPASNDSLNITVRNDFSADPYTINDAITDTPTFSVIGTNYVERVNSIQYRNVNSSIRWMSITYPNIPYDAPSIVKLGAGIFNSSPTLLDDLIDVKKNGQTTTINSVYGTLTTIDIRPQNDVILTSAGEDQTEICASPGSPKLIYLEASILGNTSGHTFLWEQLSGTVVTLVPVTTTKSYFVSTGGSTDRVFRFWIDKNKFNQQYQDITVYSTPTSYLRQDEINSTSASKELQITDDTAYYVKNIAFTTNTEFLTTIEWNSWGEYSFPLIGIEWDLPNAFYTTSDKNNYIISQFIKTVVDVFVDGEWVNVKNVTFDENRHAGNIPAYSMFRVGAVYNINGTIKTFYNPYQQALGNAFGLELLMRPSIGTDISSTITPHVLAIQPLEYSDIVVKNTYTEISITYTQTPRIFTVDDRTYNDTIYTEDTVISLSMKYTINRYSGSSIGG